MIKDSLFPLRTFAKVFETSRGQVLCTAEENEEGLPSLCFKANVQTGELVGLYIGGWPNDDAGWERADRALATTTLETAENFVAKVLPQLFVYEVDDTDAD